eukprot:TRINITY_DN63921_c0_g1_i1.p1 TRINITY_DN63921_c0_g1~~TRINITY_DN63921_c0_g1_i1.p1  ORF type:complete len:101 (-),score=1.60 TRINITY_DN63921_c0_g1_i1:149-406(-)
MEATVLPKSLWLSSVHLVFHPIRRDIDAQRSQSISRPGSLTLVLSIHPLTLPCRLNHRMSDIMPKNVYISASFMRLVRSLKCACV